MHNEEKNVRPLYEEVAPVLEGLGRPYEILFINDGSTDRTLERMLDIVRTNPHFAAVELDGNFGESGALSAGFAVARGDTVVTMDGDLQNDPADIPRMIEKIDEGYRVVSGWRRHRREPLWSRRLPSVVANYVIAHAAGVPVHDTGCSLKAYRRDVVHGQNIPRGFQRFIPAVFGVRGHEVTEIVTEDRERRHGRTHYGLSRTFAVLRDLTAIWFVNRNPRLFATVVPVGCVLGLGALLAALFLPMPAWWHWLCGVGGAVVAVVGAISTWDIRRYNRAQVEKVYRIRTIHRQAATARSAEQPHSPGGRS